MSPIVPFDMLGPLPTGRLAVEASAGTGKTFALAALATRFLTEQDISTSDLLIVTFTRAATSELRSRVRERLVEAVEHLSGDSGPSGDALLDHLAATDRELRLSRARRAVAEFDGATITTIHGFATQVLTTLGVSSGSDPDATLVDDSAQLAAECCADVLAAAALDHKELPKASTLTKLTRTAINIADLRLAPGPDDGAVESDVLLTELVERSIAKMRERRRAAGTMSFDDILVALRAAMSNPSDLAMLRNRFRVALIDEFQDTDQVQWDIFSAMFPLGGRDDSSLVLVGDPKQSIYAFRGANVNTYLQAVHSTGNGPPRTLGTNWRSDAAVLKANEVLLDGVTFGDAEIAFNQVAAAPGHQHRRLVDQHGSHLPALDIRLAVTGDVKQNQRGTDSVDAKAAIFGDLVGQVRGLLEGAQLPTGDADSTRRVRPSDIAVLVRSNKDADTVRAALRRQGIPAILARGLSVMESPAAMQWRWLLDAMTRPSDPVRARTFALSWFGGYSAQWVANADDDDLVGIQEQLSEWVGVLADRGVVEFQRRLWTDSGVVPRVLARSDGDRELTDLEHIAELLGSSAGADRHSVGGLLAVLDAPAPEEIDADIDRDQAARRVESEALAVQIMTVWVAKGLEFPIVCVPTMWSTNHAVQIVPDPDGPPGSRLFDLAGKAWPSGPEDKARHAVAAAEALGENLRLLYVALTRARHQTIVWWTPVSSAARAGLTRVLFARDDGGNLDGEAFTGEKFKLPQPDRAAEMLAPLVRAGDGTLTVTAHGHHRAPDTLWQDPGSAQSDALLAVAEPGRVPDRSTRRWSFTAISSGDQRGHSHGDPSDGSAGDSGASDESAPVDEVDEPTRNHPGSGETFGPGEVGDGSAGVPGALSQLVSGASFGTLVHSVLEHVDFTSDDLQSDLRAETVRQLARRPMDLAPWRGDGSRGTYAEGLDLLVQGLVDAIATPLGPLMGSQRLRDVDRVDRVDEMDFDLRLGNGPVAASDAELGAVIESHLAPANLFDEQPLHTWATELLDGRFGAVLAGHLTGSMDAVLRTHGPDGTPKFVVVDYKTNRLGRRPFNDPRPYAADRLAAAMADHHYPLQALLYSVALHRYLRWRLPGYDPAVHLGGVLYLFLRGMAGPATPSSGGVPDGVFSWKVPSALVTDLSDLLDGHLNRDVREVLR